ncbi:pre T-cell antigen receptor alpha isoform X2 [Anolis carolinensis]|uniref:pre T-cell antigen receptor alpha isoform X2 n=1 Tax=Anolis carolinensis TaxID=28377 RepID=UPI002F2B4908
MLQEPLHEINLIRRPLRHLVTCLAFQLLICCCSLALTPTLSPPKHVIINGERKTLLACLVRDLSKDASPAVLFSNGNGSMLASSVYGISGEEDENTMGELCLDENQGDQALPAEILHNRTQALVLLTIRMLLFKMLLFDVLMTCCIIFKK